MRKLLLIGLMAITQTAFSSEVVLEKNGITLTDDEILTVAQDLSESQIEHMKANNAMLRTFIEQIFDNKVMANAIKKDISNDEHYAVVKEMMVNKFTTQYYIKKKALEKINSVKNFSTLAKQKYQSRIKDYQLPQTADYYHVLFVKQDGIDNKTKAETLLKDIQSGKTTLAKAAKQYHSRLAGTNTEGVLEKIDVTKLMKPVQAAIANQKVGDITDVIETEAGYHILGLKQQHDIQTRPYSPDIEKQIIANIKTDMYRSTEKAIRDQYRGPEGLTVKEELLKATTNKILQSTP